MKKKIFYGIAVVVAFGLGVAATSVQESGRYFDITKNLEIFNNLYKELNTNYVDEIDPNQIMKVGIDAMLATLDPFTNYFSESQIEGFRFRNEEGEASSGLRVKKIDMDLVITGIIEQSPAHTAGLKVGDKIKSINGETTEKRTAEDVMDIIIGIPGSEMTLDIARPGIAEEMNIKITRGGMDGKNVPYSGMVDDNIGYISLTTFSRDAGRNVANALRDLKTASPDLKGVILDLRGNGGGLLREAINVCNVFIPANETVVTTRSKVVEADQEFKTRNEVVDQTIPLVILIDQFSASASEIVSGVMQDLDRGVLVGQLSYGKGLVQNTFDIGYNAKIKLTTSKYYIPSGRCIQSVVYKNGERVHIPDAQRAKFKTRAGRVVLDGGGVQPDVALTDEQKALIVQKLQDQDVIFNYVTQYCIGRDSIGPLESFRYTDFNSFTQFISKNEFKFETKTDDLIKNLKDVSKEEAYSSEVSGQVDKLKSIVEQEKTSQVKSHEKAILQAIEREILSRYYFETGLVRHQLKNDPELAEAIAVLKSSDRYNSILKGS
ncbi:MAG TPA: S41 family peptidase [Saprospiraceae bacterium]|nr:S41 family peptidase [Saprospiraceae bacterium]